MGIVPFTGKRGQRIRGLYIRKEDGTFYLVISVDGKTRFKSLRTKVESVARSRMHAAESEVRTGEKTEKGPVKLLADYWQDFREMMAANGSRPATLLKADMVWEHSLAPFWAIKTTDDVTTERADEFLKWHRRTKPGQLMFNPYKYLRALFRHMADRGAVERIPSLEVPTDEKKHQASFRGRVPTADEVQRILDVSRDKMKLMVILATERGMRQGEIASLKRSQIVSVGGELVIKLGTATKTGRARSIPVPPAAIDRLTKAMSGPSEFIFPGKGESGHISPKSIQQVWIRAVRAAKIDGRLRFHDLRHYAVNRFKKAGLDTIVACELLGMSVTQYQKTYGKLSADDIIEALRKFGGSL